MQSPVEPGGGEPLEAEVVEVAAVVEADVVVADAVFLPDEAGWALDEVLDDDGLPDVLVASAAPYHSLTP